MAYCSKQDVEQYLQTSINTAMDSQLSSWISAVQNYIERYTDRNFEASTMVKKYDGKGRNYLNIDDLLSISSVWFVSNDSTSDGGSQQISNSSIYLYQDSDPNKTPYNKLQLAPTSTRLVFPYGHQNIYVHGNFGYSLSVPAEIKVVATKLVASLVNVGKNDGVAQYSEADLSISYISFEKLINMDLGVKEILDWYKKRDSFGSFKAIRI